MLNFKKGSTPENHQQAPTVSVPDPGAKKKVRSERQSEASRRNGLRSHGPRNTDRTRCNAIKHRLPGEGLTPLDNAERYEETKSALKATYTSSNPFNAFFIEQSALEMERCRRGARLERKPLPQCAALPIRPATRPGMGERRRSNLG
jgi:hypothetical protein